MNATAKIKGKQSKAAGLVMVSGLFVAMLMGMKGCPVECPEYDPDFDAAAFGEGIHNPFFPLIPGMEFTYEKVTDDGTETVIVTVTHDTKEIMGVTCTVVHDQEFEDD